MLAEVYFGDVVCRDASPKVDRLLSHQLHQFGTRNAVAGMRRHVLAAILIDSRVEIFVKATCHKSWVIFDFSG